METHSASVKINLGRIMDCIRMFLTVIKSWLTLAVITVEWSCHYGKQLLAAHPYLLFQETRQRIYIMSDLCMLGF